MLNKAILEKITKNNAQLVLVTKYFDALKTREIYNSLIPAKAGIQSIKNPIWALGENRIDDIIAKKIPRKICHFIGNIQSRRIREISEYCSIVHSLCDLKHAKLFAKQDSLCEFFIQINISSEPQKQGVLPENFAGFYESLPKNLKIIGVSGMGKSKFTREEKIAEFKNLLKIREKFNPNWKISAGTSADYEIALEMGIDVVRIGKAIFT